MGTSKNLIAFAYYGGKNRHLKDILPLLPAADHYCECFAGSASVLLNREPSPIETLNDLNGDIVNFFRVLRDQPEPLISALMLTPYAREEFYQAWEPCDDPIEQARRFFIRATMDYAKAGAKKDRSFSTNATYDKSQFCYAPWNFMSKVEGLPDLVKRLQNVQIENRPAIELIKKYGRRGTLIYADPPYLPETRTSSNDYLHEMTIEQHFELSRALNETPAMVALSGYDCETMDALYPRVAGGGIWYKTAFKKRRVPMSRTGTLKRQEVLWTNYDPHTMRGQTKLF